MFSRITGFILRPIARFVRYAVLKLMKKIRRPNDDRPIRATSEYLLDEIILLSGFRIFQDAQFRKLASFGKLSIKEHDRIFNELEVSGMCLLFFYLQSMRPLMKPEDYHFWQDVELRVPEQFEQSLMGLGVDSANAKLFKQLIAIRHEEYQKLIKNVWEASNAAKPEFQELPEEMKYLGAAIQSVAIGTANHIKRGKLIKNDHLTGFLIDWLMKLRRQMHRFVIRL